MLFVVTVFLGKLLTHHDTIVPDKAPSNKNRLSLSPKTTAEICGYRADDIFHESSVQRLFISKLSETVFFMQNEKQNRVLCIKLDLDTILNT